MWNTNNKITIITTLEEDPCIFRFLLLRQYTGKLFKTILMVEPIWVICDVSVNAPGARIYRKVLHGVTARTVRLHL